MTFDIRQVQMHHKVSNVLELTTVTGSYLGLIHGNKYASS